MKSYLNATRQQIVDRAAELVETTLQIYHGEASVEAVSRLNINPKDKGKLGNLVEVLHFGLTLNNDPRPDFPAAGIELKTTGLKPDASGQLVAKERLPLGMIDYLSFQTPERCNFETSGILDKCGAILLVVYLYDRDIPIIDLLFKVTGLWEFPEVDLKIIRRDWEFIVKKVRDGRAHELSEGDTLYLGASTAGVGHGNLRDAPGSVRAKPRKFSLKKSYLNHICSELSGKKFGRIITAPAIVETERTLEEIVVAKFERLYGMTSAEISELLDIDLKPRAKNWAALLTKAIMKVELTHEIDEFDKAGIISRTVRLEPSNLPKQSISFPAFRFEEVVEETWEESLFREYLESRFFFVFFQFDRPEFIRGKKVKNRKLILRKVRFWNMPTDDILKAKEVWTKTIDLVSNGKIVKGFKPNGDRITHFPGLADNSVSHVRPHGSVKEDTYPLPEPDAYTGWTEYTKHCFWINNKYVRDVIYDQ